MEPTENADSDEAISDGMPVELDDERDEPPELAQSDGEDGDERMVYFLTNPDDSKCPSSESGEETAAKPVAKRVRMSARALPQSSQPRCVTHVAGQQQLLFESSWHSAREELRSLLGFPGMRQILEELDELPKFQVTKDPEGRHGLFHEEHRTECAEI